MKRFRKRILFLSNGYAEDLIAAAIIEKLVNEVPQIEIKALPLVGEGKAYEPLRILILGPRKLTPSGGFVGLNPPIIFLPTAKSDYTKGPKEHYRIEKWFIKRSCQLVLPRDEPTTRSLQDFGVRATYVGNVMMDCLKITDEDFGIEKNRYVVGILPGSKRDAYDNFPVILDAVTSIEKRVSFSGRIHFLLALPASLSLERLRSVASREHGWKITEAVPSRQESSLIADLVSHQGLIIKIIRGKFGDLVSHSQVIIGLSGMGNEQAVGLGKPVVSFPGRGPQVTEKFLRIQRTLLGGAIYIVDRNGEAVADEVCSLLLKSPRQLREIVKMGKERMGGFGAAERVAKLIKKEILARRPP